MLPLDGWRIEREGETAILIDPRGAEVLRHWYVPFVRRVQRRLATRKGLNAELVRGICRDEACFRFEFSTPYRDDFDLPRAANAAERS